MEKIKGFYILFIICFTLALADEASLQEFINGNNLFTGAVYKELIKKESDNFLVSPFSAETVLALAQSGAKDKTAQEIRNALHLPDDQDKIESAIKDIQTSIKDEQLYSFQTANKIYVKENFEINEEFKKVASDVFNVDLENIDFDKGNEAARIMNQWVVQHTNNKIHNLIDPTSLSSSTRAILINALYFKANWSVPFDVGFTSKRSFHKTPNDIFLVDTMQNTDDYKYFESSELDAKFLELPFEGADVSLTIVLPNKKDGLSALENQIDKVVTTPTYRVEYVKLHLPKFKIETKIDFKEVLQNLGVKKAFKDDEADFSGITGGKETLVIDKVIQKTFIDLNEAGVEAAAATYAQLIVPLSYVIREGPPKEFIVDHPFLFYIKVNKLIIFAGRVVSPLTLNF